MFKKLESVIKNLKGNVLVIGIDDKLISYFDKNNFVNLYSIYSNNLSGLNNIFFKNKKRKTNKGKSINIKKLKKYIKKKSTDYIILNFDEIIDYYKYIIKDTIYLNNKKIYVYSSLNVDPELILKLYKRYNVVIEVNEYKNGYLYIIDNTNGKNNYFLDKLYMIKDTFYNMAEFIGNILVG